MRKHVIVYVKTKAQIYYKDSTTLLLPRSEILNLVAVQSTLSRTWSETPKTGFLMMRLLIFASVILETEMLQIHRPISEKIKIFLYCVLPKTTFLYVIHCFGNLESSESVLQQNYTISPFAFKLY